ncbi:MAG: EAL domain-containing protein, partial [Woeseia sp.]
DQSFIQEMMRQKKDMGIVTSTISMGHKLDLTVVAEGVETQEVLDVLRRHGCDRAQGYFISRPLAENDFVEFMMRKKDALRSVSKAKNVQDIHRAFHK